VDGGARIALDDVATRGVCVRARGWFRVRRGARGGEYLCARVGARAGAMGGVRARGVGVIRCARVVEGFRVSQGEGRDVAARRAALSMNDVTDDVCDAFDFVMNRLRI
jgi:hypothetical protein